MSTALPDYYFRVRDNGAFVFRIDSENRQRRLEMDQIAVVKLRNGEIRPHGDRSLSPEDLSAIRDWMAQRSHTLAARDMDDIHRAIDHLNLTAHWAQSKASDEQLDEITDQMLLAMHDLRSVLVRKKADRLQKAAKDSDAS
ncbi:hypothetical protein MACH17_13370 [Phaeobacter inhibens]|uniref:hypothetical protein n=1 Tax=Phaeobacter inhibens TaxID=221822 RepID=UPI0027740C06|nr:hypothetical protein [Phaeobacter inhibens]GLO69820.1 hypothetical protein MACH17_13370 [Phaeobacter inhibens]